MSRLVIAAALLLSSCQPLVGHDLTTEEKDAIKAKIAVQLRDPDATQWRWPKVSPQFIELKRQGSYCGWLNAKNAFGGYTGFALYHADLTRGTDGVLQAYVVMPIGEPGRDGFERGICIKDGQALTDGPPAL